MYFQCIQNDFDTILKLNILLQIKQALIEMQNKK